MAARKASSKVDSPINADSALKREVKEAVREVVDETLVAYTNGASAFADSMTSTVASMVDAFDQFFTRNLMDDRPEVAQAFLDARLRSAQENLKTLNAKVVDLRRMKVQTATRSKRGTSRTRARSAPPTTTSNP